MLIWVFLAGTVLVSGTFENIQELPDYQKLSQNPYGSKILSTISLQLSSDKPPEEVILLLEEISNKLLDEQRKDDQLNVTRAAECKAEIEFLDRPIEVMHSEIERAKQIEAEREPLFNSTIEKRNAKDQEIRFFEGEIMSLDRNSKIDAEKLQKKYQEHEEALSAIDSSLEYMQKVYTDQESQSVKSNHPHMEIIPLDVLLEVSENQDSIVKLIDIMTDIRKDYQASLKSLIDRKLEGEKDYKELKDSISSVISDLKEIRESLDKHSLELSDDLEESRRMQREAREECGSMERARDDKVTECEAWSNQYINEKDKRSEELQIIREIQKLYSV
ncbi:unnamed protein product [Blepharisma stoltei]|uniref:Uncharacterized protein n=1 Tax=Blepharisma stoltei TaxID=1481888 RepID=A0AAU9K8W5_9CILI|nr:unnamed protein product [Blepharisma stoltei]